jgi:hypothetical protein
MAGDAGGRASVEERLDLHRRFWAGKGQSRPLASFRVGDFFFARHFAAGRILLEPGRRVEPDAIDVPAYALDYERLYGESEAIGQDGFFTAEPYTGLPWMEAMLGCGIVANAESFASLPHLRSAAEGAGITVTPGNRWLGKYLEFTRMLVERSAGRFPVGQPIMRGPTDMVGALLGQTAMVYALADEPDAVRELAMGVTRAFLSVIERQRALVPAFHDGTSLGFYHLWAPGPSIWFQDDLAALLSPALYRDFFLGCAREICATAPYTAVHLHPASFFVLDDLLSLDGLLAVEVNKDVGGPGVAEMVPTLARIMERKRLVLFGDFTAGELALLRRSLPVDGLALFVVAPTVEAARALNAVIRRW